MNEKQKWALLTDGQFAAAAEKAPWSALAHAASRLTDGQFAAAAEKAPWSALRFAEDRLKKLSRNV